MQLSKFFPLTFLLLLCLIGTALASTTTYELVTPGDNLSLGYSQNNYYKLGDLKITATESFDTGYKVVVTVSRDSAFKNKSADNSALAYDLVISSDSGLTVINNGDSFDFSAASIDAKQGLEIGTKVTADFLTAADGFYMDSLTFKASLDNAAPAGPVVGSTMTFGTYNSAAISWRVLAVDETNKRALLVTEDAVTSMAYHDSSNNWSTSNVKTFLNGTGDDQFLKEFTVAEKAKMLKVSITDGDNSDSSTIINSQGSDTVFLLSATDANNTSYFADSAARVCKLGSSNCYWWLRSPGDGGRFAVIVWDDGSVDDYGGFIVDDDNGVRPAFWLNL